MAVGLGHTHKTITENQQLPMHKFTDAQNKANRKQIWATMYFLRKGRKNGLLFC